MSQSAVVPTFAGSSTGPDADETRLHGRWLLVARVGWIALTLLILTLNVVMVPRYDAVLQAPCQPGALCFGIQLNSSDQQLLHQMGLSLGFVAGYQVMLDVVTVAVFCALATLIFWRRSADRMALFCAFMLVVFGGASFTSILQYALAPVSPAWFVLIGILDVLGQSSFLIFFLLFPSGRFVPRWTQWGALIIVLYWIYSIFFTNSLIKKADTPGTLVLFFSLLLLTVGTQIYRYRRVSTPRERQQTRWVVFGFTIGIVGFVLLIIMANVFLLPAVRQSGVRQTFVAGTALYGFLLLVPISIAIAILRSRLYDIDVIINRTLVYGSLTVILGALYAGLIIGLESVAGLISKQASQPVVLVISTLAIFVLVQPVRTRIQSLIDRRFYRRKYDAEKTLAAFSATLQSEVDLNHLRGHLLAVVQETMQPTSVSLWLRSPGEQSNLEAHRNQPGGREGIPR
jgi:hypothetical protein